MSTAVERIFEDMQALYEATLVLRDYKVGTNREPRREGWLQAIERIVEPWMGSGKPVPIGEIVCDARWGIWVVTGPGGQQPPELVGRRGHEYTRFLADLDFWEATQPLANIPEEEISPLVAACVASMTLIHGPMQFVPPDLDNIADLLRVRKILLHKASTDPTPLEVLTGRRRKRGGWSVLEGLRAPPEHRKNWWRDYMAELAEAAGLPHPNHLSRLRNWLHPDLRQRPRWLRDS